MSITSKVWEEKIEEVIWKIYERTYKLNCRKRGLKMGIGQPSSDGEACFSSAMNDYNKTESDIQKDIDSLYKELDFYKKQVLNEGGSQIDIDNAIVREYQRIKENDENFRRSCQKHGIIL